MVLSTSPYLATEYGGPPRVIRAVHSLMLRHDDGSVLLATASDEESDLQGIITCPLTFRFFFISLAFMKQAWRLARSADVILVHTLYTFPTLWTFLLSMIFGKPYLFFPHGMLDRDSIHSSGRLKNFCRRAYVETVGRMICRFAGKVIFNSEKERGNARFGERDNCIVVPNGIWVSELPEPAVDSPFRAGAVPAFFLGRLHPIKGLDILVDAVGMLSDQDRAFLDLQIAGGGDEQYETHIRMKVEESGLSDTITLIGHIDDIVKFSYLAHASIYLQPSMTEGLSISMLEAMASGTAILTTRNVGLSGELQESDAALVIDYDAVQLAEALTTLIRDGALRERLSVNALDLVRETYDWEIIGQEYMELIREI